MDNDWGPDWEEDKVQDLGNRETLVKAHFIGRDVPMSNVVQAGEKSEDRDIYEKVGVLPTPYNPDVLCKLWEHSNSLRQNVDAYVVNIDGNGHRFEPVIDLEADDAFDQVRDALFLERLTEGEDTGLDPTKLEFPTDSEVKQQIESMGDAMRLEKAKLDAFFRFCSIDESFISIRKKARQDMEIMGNGYWEILRNHAGEPAQFTYLPGFTVRLLPLDQSPIAIVQKVKRAPLTYEEIQVWKRFRRFVQVFEGRTVFYKELGDPRVVSSRTGMVYKTVADLQSAEGSEGVEVQPATEILHFAVHNPRGPYGIPRWVGTMLAVLGSRQSEEVNFLYFENKSVPPMAVLVSGGRLNSQSVTRLESFVESRIKGRRNFHKILVIEAERPTGALDQATNGRMKIEIVPLTGAQQSDALFQKYDERNIDKVGMAFRLPRLLRGDIRDFNRATAEAALEFAETQVFAPEREEFDWLINRKLLAELGIRFWTFQSNSPTTRNPIDLSSIIAELVRASILTPEEARELAKGIFNRDFKKIKDMWVKIPPDLLKAGIFPESSTGGQVPNQPAPKPNQPNQPNQPDQNQPPTGQSDQNQPVQASADRYPIPPAELRKRYADGSRARQLRSLAKDLIELRDVLRLEEETAATSSHAEAQAVEMEREVVTLSDEDFASLFEAE